MERSVRQTAREHNVGDSRSNTRFRRPGYGWRLVRAGQEQPLQRRNYHNMPPTTTATSGRCTWLPTTPVEIAAVRYPSGIMHNNNQRPLADVIRAE